MGESPESEQAQHSHTQTPKQVVPFEGFQTVGVSELVRNFMMYRRDPNTGSILRDPRTGEILMKLKRKVRRSPTQPTRAGDTNGRQGPEARQNQNQSQSSSHRL